MSTQEYGPEIRNRARFGFGAQGVWRPLENEENALKKRALMEGWKNGCPIAEELTGPSSPYSIEWMINRYQETNIFFTIIKERAKRMKHPFAIILSTPQMRLYSESVGKHEPQSVPLAHKYQISPMSGIYGYAAPRVAIEISKKNKYLTGLDAIEEALKSSMDNPMTFLASLSEMAVKQYQVDPVSGVLHHVYAQGVLDEQNCNFTYYDLAGQLDGWAPNVWYEYSNLSGNDKKRMAIAEVPDMSRFH